MLDQINLKDLYRPFHPNATEYTFPSSEHGTFSRTDHFLWHKTSLNKFKKTKTTLRIFSGYNGMKLEINSEKDGKLQIYGD